MFEHFTFGAQPQTQPPRHYDDAFPSPTDTSFPSPPSPPPAGYPFPPQGGINDIVAKFAQQSLQSRDQLAQQFQAWQNYPPFSTDDSDDNMEPEDTQSLPGTPLLPARATLACRRLQRQLNVQLQSCTSHIRDINSLVEGMITSNSQWVLHNSTSRQPLSSQPPSRAGDELIIDLEEYDEPREMTAELDVDEGFHEEEDEDSEMTLRRASTPSGIRKYGIAGLRYKGSAECMMVQGKLKVRCIPRMRKRKPVPLPE
jgi:hypothetical protein